MLGAGTAAVGNRKEEEVDVVQEEDGVGGVDNNSWGWKGSGGRGGNGSVGARARGRELCKASKYYILLVGVDRRKTPFFSLCMILAKAERSIVVGEVPPPAAPVGLTALKAETRWGSKRPREEEAAAAAEDVGGGPRERNGG